VRTRDNNIFDDSVARTMNSITEPKLFLFQLMI